MTSTAAPPDATVTGHGRRIDELDVPEERRVLSPDEFVLALAADDPDLLAVVEAQALALSNPPMTAADLFEGRYWPTTEMQAVIRPTTSSPATSPVCWKCVSAVLAAASTSPPSVAMSAMVGNTTVGS